MSEEAHAALWTLIRTLNNAVTDPVLCQSIAHQIQELVRAEIKAAIHQALAPDQG